MDAKNESDTDALREEIEQLRADLSRMADTLNTIVSDRAGVAYQRVKSSAENAAAQASRAADSVGSEISSRPFASVVTAFGVGVVIGILFGRRA